MAPPENAPDWLKRLHGLVDEVKSKGHIKTELIERAFRKIFRHIFLPVSKREEAYKDQAILTKEAESSRSTSSQPSMMAIMLEQLKLKKGHNVLEVGTGTGYNAALLGEIVGAKGHVVSIEIDQELVDVAARNLRKIGLGRVQVVCADGGLGFSTKAPYDRILCTAAVEDIPPLWIEQLMDGGRIVVPLKFEQVQLSVTFVKKKGYLQSVGISGCSFLPMQGVFDISGGYSQLGPKPGLSIIGMDHNFPNENILLDWLDNPGKIRSTNLCVSPSELGFPGMGGKLIKWLSLHRGGSFLYYRRGGMPVTCSFCNGRME